jgi:hypothetical protein
VIEEMQNGIAKTVEVGDFLTEGTSPLGVMEQKEKL